MRKYVIIHLRNRRYGMTGRFKIDQVLWLKHRSMHSVRPEEALQNNLAVCYGTDTPVTTEMIEKVIEDEYRIRQDLPNIMVKARKKYENLYYG